MTVFDPSTCLDVRCHGFAKYSEAQAGDRAAPRSRLALHPVLQIPPWAKSSQRPHRMREREDRVLQGNHVER